MRILEAAGAQANYTLLSACCEGNLNEVARLLRTPGAAVNQANKDGETPLFLASREGHTEVVEALLAAPGIAVNQADNDGETPLWWASREDHTEVVEALLATPGIDVNQANEGNHRERRLPVLIEPELERVKIC